MAERPNIDGVLKAIRRADNSRFKVRCWKAYGEKALCVYCAKGAATVDHVLPRACGGNNDLGNTVPCCRQCNGLKKQTTPGVFFLRYPGRAKQFAVSAIHANPRWLELARNAGQRRVPPANEEAR